MLHRELGHRQIISDRHGYETQLIGWIELNGQHSHWDDEAIRTVTARMTASLSNNTPELRPEAID